MTHTPIFDSKGDEDKSNICAAALVKMRENWRGIPRETSGRGVYIDQLLEEIATEWPKGKELADGWKRLNSGKDPVAQIEIERSAAQEVAVGRS